MQNSAGNISQNSWPAVAMGQFLDRNFLQTLFAKKKHSATKKKFERKIQNSSLRKRKFQLALQKKENYWYHRFLFNLTEKRKRFPYDVKPFITNFIIGFCTHKFIVPTTTISNSNFYPSKLTHFRCLCIHYNWSDCKFERVFISK